MGNTLTTHVQGLDLIPSRKLKEGIKDREGKEGKRAEFTQMNLTYFHITQSRFRKLLGWGGGRRWSGAGRERGGGGGSGTGVYL